MSIARFSSLVASQPDNELFRFSLAQSYLRENRPDEALPHLEFCAAKKDDWMMVRILLGQIHLKARRIDTARTWLQSALSLAVEQHHEEPERDIRAMLASLP